MANNPGHSEINETVVDVTMLEVVAEPDKKSSDAATSSTVEEVVSEIPRKMNEVEGFRQRYVDEIEAYCAMNWQSRNVVHDQGSSGFYKVPQNMRQRQGWERLFYPTYINFSKIREMLENDDPDVQTRSLLNHYYYHFLAIHRENPEVKLENYLLMIYEHRKEIARCYGVEEADLDFPQLLGLLLSIFFVIYLFATSFRVRAFDTMYDRECFHKMIGDLWIDLLVLENQIPFFILQRVFDSLFWRLTHRPAYDSIGFYIHYYYWRFVPLNRYDKQLKPVHLLDIVHRSLLPDKQSDHRSFFTKLLEFCYRLRAFLWGERKFYPRQPADMRVIPTATRLQEAGVQFWPVEEKGFVVEFKKGVLTLPRLHIKRNTEKFFINLIAWERCHQPAVKYVINFAILIDHLINTSEDVEILIQNNVLELSQVTEEEVVAMFNRLGEDIIYTENERHNREYDFLIELSYNLNKYCESRLNIWWEYLMKVYSSSPWTILSLIGALLLILVTPMQTFFSAFSYFRPPK